jgi:hypothetical protein
VAVRTALDILVLVLLALNLALSLGIVRRMRLSADPDRVHGGHSSHAPTRPPAGFTVDLSLDEHGWDDPAAAEVVRGSVLAAFVAPGCLGCERLHHELEDYGPLPVPLYVIMDPFMHRTSMGHSYLQTWDQAQARLVAPTPLDILESFGKPDEFPTLVLLRDGLVVASGHRLHEVSRQFGSIPADALGSG